MNNMQDCGVSCSCTDKVIVFFPTVKSLVCRNLQNKYNTIKEFITLQKTVTANLAFFVLFLFLSPACLFMFEFYYSFINEQKITSNVPQSGFLVNTIQVK